MAFKRSYEPTYDGTTTSCILDFFGFKRETKYVSHSRGVYVRDDNEKSGQRK